MSNTYFYQDKPIFGLDIGFSSLKVMQVDNTGKNKLITGYGATNFDSKAIKNGVIVEPEIIAKALKDLFEHNLIGEISTRRVSATIPASRTFNRTITLPKLSKKDLDEALLLEAEQYIPMPIDDLYMDYHIISESDKGLEVFVVAVPKIISNSYVDLMNISGLEPVTLETSISAASRLFVQAEQSDLPSILIDFGSLSSDITIYDKGLIVTGTVSGGGDNFTDSIAKKLKISHQESHIVKTKYGLGKSKKQNEITEALTPLLDQLLREIKRIIRYYEDRSATKSKISQVVTMGGGANLPGLSEYITDKLRLPTRMCDPWQHLDFSKLQPPNTIEKSMYVSVAGLALIDSKEVYK
ncbi:MAG: type IV pilus assembly protein PilM [Candidatus Saccharimonadales bacterium]